jgi:GNAT superfamily N-acetyltransferase
MGPMDFVLRRAEAPDAAAVTTVVRAAYSRWVPVLGREPLPMCADYERNIQDHRIEVLIRNGEVAAVLETIDRPDHVWIENIAVSPQWQGKGLGRRLLAHAEGLAIGLGLSTVRLLTNAAFEPNIALYGRTGYVVDRTEPFMGGATVHMSKRLRPQG